MTFIILYLSMAFTLMISIFHYKQLKKSKDDLQAMLIYFMLFFILFLIVPLVLVVVTGTNFPYFLKRVGFSFGRKEIGWMLVAFAFPITILAGFIGSRDPKMKDQYPLSKTACNSLKTFTYYEIGYFILYYFTWEFLYRGFLFFSLLHSYDLFTALSIQTIISTVYHIGHPFSEIFAAFIAGFIFGLIAYYTQSFFYTFLIHGFIGISTDSFIFRRYYRRKK